MMKIQRGRRITKRLRLSRLGCFVRKLPVMTAGYLVWDSAQIVTRHNVTNVTYPGDDEGEDGKSFGSDQSVPFLSSLS